MENEITVEKGLFNRRHQLHWTQSCLPKK